MGVWEGLDKEVVECLGIKNKDAVRTRMLGAKAYKEALAWKTVNAHPPGAKQPGFGSWARAPK